MTLRGVCPKVVLTDTIVYGMMQKCPSQSNRGILYQKIIKSAVNSAQASSTNMTFSTILSGATLCVLIAVCVQLIKVKNRQNRLLAQLEAWDNFRANLHQLLSDHKNCEENTVRAITEICNAINAYFTTSTNFMELSVFALQNISACMLPFIDYIKEEAIDEDNYEKAQECINIIKNLKEIINLAKNG